MSERPRLSTVVIQRQRLRTGDWVQVRSAAEILASLDANGTLDGLPFMPEMLPFCGQTFRVIRRAEKTCVEVAPGDYSIQAFRHNDVVLLEELRCSGSDHEGCQRGCMLFWKEAWLRRGTDGADSSAEQSQGEAALRARLRTRADGTRFVCQSTELRRATSRISRFQRMQKCIEAMWSGSRGPMEMILFIGMWLWRRVLRGSPIPILHSNQKTTPTEALGLRPGELIEVKSVEEILPTLDAKGRNRGLQFDLLLGPYCRRQYRVRQRLDRMIMEPSGEMRAVQNTVTLDGPTCRCAYTVLGGCPREELVYWREIWLKRVDSKNGSNYSG